VLNGLTLRVQNSAFRHNPDVSFHGHQYSNSVARVHADWGRNSPSFRLAPPGRMFCGNVDRMSLSRAALSHKQPHAEPAAFPLTRRKKRVTLH
jgi:hypothetical protein